MAKFRRRLLALLFIASLLPGCAPAAPSDPPPEPAQSVPEPAAEAQTASPDAQAAEALADMTRTQKIAQLFFVSPEALLGDSGSAAPRRQRLCCPACRK